MVERRQIMIQGKPYQLVWIDHLRGALGTNDVDHLKIEMERGHPDPRTISTLLHEALHVIDHEMHLELSHEIIDRIESGLYSFFAMSGVDLRPLIWED